MNDQTSALLGAVQESLREQLEAAERTFQRLQHALSTRDSAQIAALAAFAQPLAVIDGPMRWSLARKPFAIAPRCFTSEERH